MEIPSSREHLGLTIILSLGNARDFLLLASLYCPLVVVSVYACFLLSKPGGPQIGWMVSFCQKLQLQSPCPLEQVSRRHGKWYSG